MRCAIHPEVETNLSCGKCGQPICPKCMVQTPVGARCPNCAKLYKLPTYRVSTGYYLRAIGTALGMAIVCGLVWEFLNYIARTRWIYTVPLFEELKTRLEERGQESPDLIKNRLEVARKDIRFDPDFDCIIINDELKKAVNELEAIILSTRCRLDIKKKEIVPILRSFSEDK